MTLRPFDPQTATQRQWSAFHLVRRLLFIEDAPERAIPGDTVIEGQLREHDPHWAVRWWLAFDGAEPVGRIQVATRGGDDPSRYGGRVFVTAGVLPGQRRQGFGRQLMRHLSLVMAEESHSTAVFPLSSLALGGPFLERLGARLVYREVDNRLDLTGADLAALEASVEAVPASLRWEVHRERVPLDRLRALAPEISLLLADTPRQDLSFPPPLFEVASYEARYRQIDAIGGAHVFVLILDGDQVVAVCDSIVPGASPDLALQTFTGVASIWRGRGLGVAVKARTLQLLRERDPAIRTVQTRNATTNAPMLRVNAQLGFRVFRESGAYEISGDALAREYVGCPE